jgi:hypothetical protein
MGYRSEVSYRIGFRDKKTLNEFIAKIMVLGGAECEALKECQLDDGGDGRWFVNFYASDVKWYDGYTDVDGHTHLYNLAVEWYPEDCAYQFLRVGESDDDSQCDTDGADDVLDYVWDDFRIVRYIEAPFSGDYEPIGDKLSMVE